MATASEEEEEGVAVKLGSFFKMYRDGRIERGGREMVPASPVASKDVRVGEKGQWARIYLPPPEEAEEGKAALRRGRFPVVLYFHGGGMVFGSPGWSNFHAFCSEMAERSRTIWVSASYRLAPEHRLPAAIEDCIYALDWLINSASSSGGDPWLSSFADLSRGVFLCGESAGGNLAHHVAMSTISRAPSLKPITVLGLILVHPGFLRQPPTPEELACPTDELMNWDMADACVRFILPPNCPKSNPFLNPLLSFQEFADSSFHYADSTLVTLADRDALHFLGLDYADALRRAGRRVEVFMSHGVGHVFFIAQPQSEQAQALMDKITDFIRRHCAAAAIE